MFRGRALTALIASAFASLCLCVILCTGFLIADVLHTGGSLTLKEADVRRLSYIVAGRGDESAAAPESAENATGNVDSSPADAAESPSAEPPPMIDPEGSHGLLPTVWWSRDRFWGPAVAFLYRTVPAFQRSDTALLVLIAFAAVVGLIRSLLLSGARRRASRTGLDVATRLRRSVHRHRLRLGPGDLNDAQLKESLTHFSDDADQVHDGVVESTYAIGRYPFKLLLLLVIALCMNWLITLECLIPMAACWYLISRQQHRRRFTQQLAANRTKAELRQLGEGLRKARLVRGYGMEDFEHTQFDNYLDRFRDSVAAEEKGERLGRWITRTLVMVCGAVVVFLLGSRVLNAPENLSFSAAIFLVAVFYCMYGPLERLSRLPGVRERAALAAERIYRYLNRIPDVSQAVGAKFLEPLSKSLYFESVSFVAPDRRKLLDNLDLRLKAGESVAVVSPDPMQSTALAYLLPRFIEPTSGRVLIDGEDVAWVTLESLRAETIYVGGSDPFFTGTVLENLTLGSTDYSLQDATDAAKRVHAHGYIQRLTQGYETMLGEHGEQLDAGQAFLLGLARAVLRDPALLIIQEPDSAMDDDAKALVDDAYSQILRDRTVIFLPTRLSTLKRADRVVLLHKGRVEAAGKQPDLVKSSPMYRHWEYMRFNEFRHTVESGS